MFLISASTLSYCVACFGGFRDAKNIDEIPGNVGVTSDWATNCQAWNGYQNAAKPAEDDSGL